jgi:hypothetical protein
MRHVLGGPCCEGCRAAREANGKAQMEALHEAIKNAKLLDWKKWGMTLEPEEDKGARLETDLLGQVRPRE